VLLSADTTQLLYSAKFCKLRYDTIPVQIASANGSFYTNNPKMPNFELWHSCCKWAICGRWLNFVSISIFISNFIQFLFIFMLCFILMYKFISRADINCTYNCHKLFCCAVLTLVRIYWMCTQYNTIQYNTIQYIIVTVCCPLLLFFTATCYLKPSLQVKPLPSHCFNYGKTPKFTNRYLP